MSREFGVSKEAMARAWVDGQRDPVAIIVARNGRIERQYRNEDFPWLPRKSGDLLPADSLAASRAAEAGSYSEIEEVEPDAWLAERDAGSLLGLTEQVLGQSNGCAMVLLQAEIDED
jgi:hypothetical protein